MDPAAFLEQGRTILDPVLVPHGFRFVPGDQDVGSGGPYAQAAYVRDGHRLSFSVRHTLGEVYYRVGDSEIAHEALMRVVAGGQRTAYPGFSADPLDGFRHLREDLERHGDVFLRTMDEDFHAFVEQSKRSLRTGFARLADAEPGR